MSKCGFCRVSPCVCGARWEDDEPEESPMTQPEPTRDPRLLSAAELERLQVTFKDRLHISGFEVRPLFAHIAAQDQRHAALCGLVTDVRAILDMWHQKGNQHEYVVAWMEGLARRIKEIQAAQPPGDERRGGK
jgi:hypothetical protein